MFIHLFTKIICQIFVHLKRDAFKWKTNIHWFVFVERQHNKSYNNKSDKK